LRTRRFHRRWAQAGISWRYHGLCPWGSIKILKGYEPCITAITAYELYLGYMKMKRRDRIDDFIYQFVILPFDLKASEVSANIESSLDRKGKGIGIPDTLIAGICISNNLPLLTLNTVHFSRVTGLNLFPIE